MIRIVALLVLVLAAWFALRWLFRFLKDREIDWTGVSFAVGFVVLAFWLHGATGIG